MENPNRVQQCYPVMEHATSPHADGALETLTLQQGFWRTSPTSKDIRECYKNSACVGGTEGYCNEGYEGPRESAGRETLQRRGGQAMSRVT